MKISQILPLALLVGLILSGTVSRGFGSDVSVTNALLEGYSWTLQIDGVVHNPINLTLSDLAAMPESNVSAVLSCSGVIVAAGVWTGPQLSLLLEKAEFDNQTTSVYFYAKDGYQISLPIEEAMREDVIIAYALNDQPLPELRLVVPGANGELWIAMITLIEACVDSAASPSPQPSPSPTPSPSPSLTPSPSPSPSPSPQPSPSPTPSPSPSAIPTPTNAEIFPTSWIVVVAAATTIIGAILIVYNKKSRK